MKIKLVHKFEDIISMDNFLYAWKEFLKDKKSRLDVQKFSLDLMNNILTLNSELVKGIYKHGGYEAFKINDPKPRDIHKASVRDRLLHHAIYRILYPFFDRKFIADSFSCRLKKGTHRAINRFRKFYFKVSKNNTKTCWILKCDIRKFFANIDHKILMEILKEHIDDDKLLRLLKEIIGSFPSSKNRVGLPLGNLTSQLFVNIYMNKFDQFIKHKLKTKHYIRYCDDFVILSNNHGQLINYVSEIQKFLADNLKIELHPDKVFIKTFSSGVDFLGWVNFPDHRILRTATKRKMLRNIAKSGGKKEIIQSYLGLIRHGNTIKLKQKILNSLYKTT
ncbi:MAG: reverse transcriptase/maturase family protein [Patescibacteria group bacterium]